ncbi:MAG: TIGR02996 domain-containing protein [Planctomycetes bacterium]|nr:TIGR02996 domain-containing protein [Planctomycetota bacterium]
MPNTELMRAVLADPGADAPRLAYATWLKSNGDPDRAEFIRVQCARAAKDRFDPARERLEKKEQALLKKHDARWRGELPEWARTSARFQRGFVGTVGIDLDTFVKRAAELMALAPVQGLALSSSGASAGGVRALAKCPQTARLTSLSISYNDVGDAGAKALAASPLFASLTHLGLYSCGITDAGVKALATSPHLTGVTELALELGRGGLTALAASRWRPSVLLIHGAPLDGAALPALARWDGLAPVVELGVSGCGIGPRGAETLAACPHLANLRVLDVSCNPLTAAGIGAILGAPWAKNLVELHLQACDLDNAAGLAIARAPQITGLKKLALMNNRFEEESRRALIARFGKMVVPY